MDLEVLIPLFGIFFVIGVPVMSLAARFVLRPLIKDLTEAVRGMKGRERTDFEARLGRIEEQVLEQGQRLDTLVEAELFRRRLESGAETQENPAPAARSAVTASGSLGDD